MREDRPGLAPPRIGVRAISILVLAGMLAPPGKTQYIISTIAGNGSQGYSGDGGTGTGAQLNSPLGVSVDSVAKPCIADSLNNGIRRWAVNGVISTMAGGGSSFGDGGPATNAQFEPLG